MAFRQFTLRRLRCLLRSAALCGMAGLVLFSIADGLPAQARGHKRSAAGQQQAYSQRPDSSMMAIRTVRFRATDATVVIEGDRPFDGTEHNFGTLKLFRPYRLILDVPNAYLAGGPKIIPVRQHGIQEIELSENRGQFYSSARIAIVTQDYETLEKLSVANLSQRIQVSARGTQPVDIFDSSAIQPPAIQSSNIQAPLPNNTEKTPPTPFEKPAITGENIVQQLLYQNDQVLVRTQAGSQLRVKNQFVLRDPNRLVIDLDNAALVSPQNPPTPLSLNDWNIQKVRMAQFDPNTVRLVIEALSPDNLSLTYPDNNKTTLAIGTNSGNDIRTLPSNTPLGELSQLNLARENDEPVVKLTATAAIVHRITKTGKQIVIELPNVAAQTQNIEFDPIQFPEIQAMRLESLAAGQPNSKLIVTLAKESTELYSELSADGQTLQLSLLPTDWVNVGALPPEAVLQKVRALKAHVVVDAGHGGKDLGANREGINEKDLNLAVALRLKQALEARGVQVTMTRSTDIFLPLSEISAISNRTHPDLFVSVHTNASVNTGMTGLETYYYTPQSIPLANAVHQKLVNAVSSPDRGVRRAMFYVIHHTQAPSILCEMGYISNTGERGQLVTEARKQRTANAIADGVVSYLLRSK